jgi:rod shape determining protein RodA
VRRQRSIFHNTDWVLLTLYIILVIMGWVNIYAAVYDENHSSIIDFHQKYGKQLIWIVAAFFLAMMTLFIDGKIFSQVAWFVYGFCLIMLFVVIIIGTEISGSKSWFQVGGMALQPAEFAKMAVALALARYLSGMNTDIKKSKTLLISAAICLIPAFLIILQHDTGSAIVFLCFILVFYRAGMSGKLTLFLVAVPLVAVLSLIINKFIITGILLVTATLFYFNTKRKISDLLSLTAVFLFFAGLVFSIGFVFDKVLEPHQKTRINVLFGSNEDLKGSGYNINQSLIAVGSGGFKGKGFMQGTQTKYNFVPEQSTDFIFCTVGEEWGFVGSSFVIFLFLALFTRIIQVAERQRSRFSRLYGYGVAAILFFHFTVNIGMVLGLLPVVGIPLPFFSYGGSSLWAFTILLFIFIRQDSYRYELL